MSLLLAPDAVTLYPPSGEADSHGWAEPGAEAAWSGSGNLQLSFGVTDPRAEAGGGRGPFKPAHEPAGLLYLPPEAPEPANGTIAEVHGRRYVLSNVHPVSDPIPGAGVACWVASVTIASGAFATPAGGTDG